MEGTRVREPDTSGQARSELGAELAAYRRAARLSQAQLSKLTEDTSLRYLYSKENLPSVVWMVIYAGLFITIGFSYFFGLETFGSQALMCAIFSALLGLTILAILELAHPYQGSVVVSAQPLRYALSRMDDMDKVALGGLHGYWDWQTAEREFRRAIELNPNYATAHHWYSLYLAHQERRIRHFHRVLDQYLFGE